MKPHIPIFLSNSSFISFCSAKTILLAVRCCQNEQLERNHQPSGKAFPPVLIQWVCARLFAPSVGHESVEGGRVDSWNCQFWNATYWEVLEFTSKGIKTKYSASPKGRLLKYGGISDEGFLFPDTQSSFLSFTASFWGRFCCAISRDISCETVVRNCEEIIIYYTVSSWSKGLEAERPKAFAWFWVRGRVTIQSCVPSSVHSLTHTLNAHCIPSAGGWKGIVATIYGVPTMCSVL